MLVYLEFRHFTVDKVTCFAHQIGLRSGQNGKNSCYLVDACLKHVNCTNVYKKKPHWSLLMNAFHSVYHVSCEAMPTARTQSDMIQTHLQDKKTMHLTHLEFKGGTGPSAFKVGYTAGCDACNTERTTFSGYTIAPTPNFTTLKWSAEGGWVSSALQILLHCPLME